MDSGIFEIIQFSRHTVSMDLAMLGAYLFFWKKTNNNFYLRCGMMGPMLFEVLVIIGLHLDGEVVHHYSIA